MRQLRFAIVALLLGFVAGPAHAILSAVGPVNPQNGFPLWYQDASGLSLEIGLDPLLNINSPVDPTNPFSVQTGFGDEGFYWSAETILPMPGGGQALWVGALEAAYSVGGPVDGDQIVFGRVRVRVDTPVAGTYTITHPFGTMVRNAPAGTRAINESIDIGVAAGIFTGALSSQIGPFLVAVNPPPPPGWVGNPLINQTVTGSPTGNNFVRIEGPPGSNLDGVGGTTIQTNFFSVAGKIYTGVVPTPLSVNKATYKRLLGGQVDVFAESVASATVSVTGNGLPTANLTGDGTGRFYGQLRLADANTLPATLTVAATGAAGGEPTTLTPPLVDAVTITRAEFDRVARTLTIEAASGDQLVPRDLLAVGFVALTNGSLVVTNIDAPPAEITVTSSGGGQDKRAVDVKPEDVLNQPPVAANDTVETGRNTAITINVLANDTDADSLIDAGSVALVALPVNGGAVVNADGTITYTPANNYLGTDTFTYTVNDSLGATSLPATVTVNVINAPPVAGDDAATTLTDTPVTINVVANDTDPDGTPPTVVPGTVAVATAPTLGAAVANADGTITYTPAAGLAGIGTATFTYTVQDAAGAVSNAATVTVTTNGTLSITSAVYQTSRTRWIVSGVELRPAANQRVRIHLGPLTGPTIATVQVRQDGTWSANLGNRAVRALAGDTVSAETVLGSAVTATTEGFPVTILR